LPTGFASLLWQCVAEIWYRCCPSGAAPEGHLEEIFDHEDISNFAPDGDDGECRRFGAAGVSGR
jgi:hypothetical protein